MGTQDSYIFLKASRESWRAGFHELSAFWSLLGYWSGLKEEIEHTDIDVEPKWESLIHLGNALTTLSVVDQINSRLLRLSSQILLQKSIEELVKAGPSKQLSDAYMAKSRLFFLLDAFDSSKDQVEAAIKTESYYDPGKFIDRLALSFADLSLRNSKRAKKSLDSAKEGLEKVDLRVYKTLFFAHFHFCNGLNIFYKSPTSDWRQQFETAEKIYKEVNTPNSRYYLGLLYKSWAAANRSLALEKKARMKSVSDLEDEAENLDAAGILLLCGDDPRPYSVLGFQNKKTRAESIFGIRSFLIKKFSLRFSRPFVDARERLQNDRLRVLAALPNIIAIAVFAAPGLLAISRDVYFQKNCKDVGIMPVGGPITNYLLGGIVFTTPSVIMSQFPAETFHQLERLRNLFVKGA